MKYTSKDKTIIITKAIMTVPKTDACYCSIY